MMEKVSKARKMNGDYIRPPARRLASAVLALAFLTGLCFAQGNTKKTLLSTLSQELKRLKLREALIVPYNSLYDETPRWSRTSDAIAFKIDGKWHIVHLNRLRLTASTWRANNSRIGIIESESSFSEVSEGQVKDFIPFAGKDPRKAKLKNGTIIELPNQDMSTSLIVTRKGGKAEKWWSSGLENCYAPTPSPDEKYVAYIAELNGIVVMNSPGK